jgi:hypothetical protein
MRSAIRSLMFLKEKYRADGSFEKLKARLVANGSQQARELFESLSSPTSKQRSIMLVAGIAAMEGRDVATADIIGAYLKVLMKGKPVYVRLDKATVDVLVRIDPSYDKLRLPDGSVIVVLLKAMYGCVQSALLLFESVRDLLLQQGFVQNPYDLCVFNRTGVGGAQCTVCLYVDDLLLTCKDAAEIDAVLAAIAGVYGECTVCRGKVHNYVGMTLDFSEKGACKVTMKGYIDELLKQHEVKGSAATPAAADLFEVSDDAPALDASGARHFHSTVAQLQYLAKRLYAALSPALAFLATRVQAPTVQDQRKLERVLRFVNSHRDVMLVLRFTEDMQVELYIDAAFAVHKDMRSHTGSAMRIGTGGMFAWRSVKQKLTTKSSTEAELVGASDEAGDGIETREFLQAQGHPQKPVIIYQDNQSALALFKRGRGSANRTRHINIRYFWLKDRAELKEVRFKYLATESMVADVLTKPLQGGLFARMSAALMHGA